eukprot:COSAG06_NODE_4387_length_4310_cov_19.067205_5_plen_148_part_00
MAAPGGMQLLGLSVTGPREGAEDVVLASAMDLSQFSFFQRGTCVCERRPREQRLSASRRSLASDRRCCAPAACSMADLLKFFFRTFTKRTDPGTVCARTATPVLFYRRLLTHTCRRRCDRCRDRASRTRGTCATSTCGPTASAPRRS